MFRALSMSLLLAGLAAPIAAQTPPSYALQFLGPASSVLALSEDGVVVGQQSVGNNTRGFVASATQPLVLLPIGAGDQSSWALDVNEEGVIVGAVSVLSSPEFQGRAARWTPNGAGGWTLQELGKLPGHVASVATAVNNVGDVVGYSSSGMFRLPVWFTAPGGLMDLNPFGVFDPQSINDARVFVDKQAKRMDLDTMQVQSLGLPASPPNWQATTGYDINELGHVAGTAVLTTSTSCVYRAARYLDGTGWQLLTPCSGLANASEINDLGDVVYQWALIDRILHLEGLGEYIVGSLLAPSAADWEIHEAFAIQINDARQLAVIASNGKTGQTGAALLTPVQGCQADLGFAGPGLSHLQVCGGSLASGTQADLTLFGAAPLQPAFLFAGLVHAPTPVKGGVLVPVPWQLVATLVAGPTGSAFVGGIPGGGGPATLYVQAVHQDAALPAGWGFSNAVGIELLP